MATNSLGTYIPESQLTSEQRTSLIGQISQNEQKQNQIMQQAINALRQGKNSWNSFVDSIKSTVNPINQTAADWNYLKELPTLLSTIGSNFEHLSDKNQYETSMGDIQNLINRGGTITQLLEAAKNASISLSNARTQTKSKEEALALESYTKNLLSLSDKDKVAKIAKVDPNLAETLTVQLGLSGGRPSSRQGYWKERLSDALTQLSQSIFYKENPSYATTTTDYTKMFNNGKVIENFVDPNIPLTSNSSMNSDLRLASARQTQTTSTKPYTGSSIVDYLNSISQDSSYTARAALAKQYGITNYRGTADQNTQLLNLLRAKNAGGASTPVPTTTTADLSSLSQYPQEFQNYINSIKDKVTFNLDSGSIAELYDQYKTMRAPESPTGNSAPMQAGEYEMMVDRYKQAGYTDVQAKAAVDALTANRAPYEGDLAQQPTYSENSMIDAIVKALNPLSIANAQFKWTPELEAEAKAIAEKDFGTYYGRIYEQEQGQLRSDLETYGRNQIRNEEDTALKKESLKTTYDQTLQDARRAYASSGLTYSTERGKKEGQLSEALTKGLTGADTALTRSNQDIETMRREALMKAEQRLGTSTVTTMAPGYQTPYSESYVGDIEREKQKQIAADIEKQKENYLKIYS